MKAVKFPFYARVALSLFSIVLLFLILRTAAGILIPLLFALLTAILLIPLNNFFEEKLKMGRAVSAVFCILLFVGALSGFLYFIVKQLILFSDDFPALQSRFADMFGELQSWLSLKLHVTAGLQTEYIGKSTMRIIDNVGAAASNVLLYVSGVLLLMIFVLLFTFFILYYRKLLMRFLLHLFGDKYRMRVQEVVMESKSMINAYIVGLVIEMVLVGVFSCAVLLVMGVKYPFLFGVMVAMLNVIPYVGFYTSVIVCMVVTFANSSLGLALQAGTGLFILHALDSNILFPRVIGRRVRMNPFITLLVVIIGQYVWGVPGMFLSIPIAGTAKLICARVSRLEAWSILMGMDDED